MKSLTPQRDLIETELSQVIPQKINTDLGKQGPTDYKRIIIRKGDGEIQTLKYIWTFHESLFSR